MINEKIHDPALRETAKQGVITFVQETKNIVNVVGEKINDPEFRQNVKDVSASLADSAKKVF
jgi:hypothetical protein